MVMGLLLSQTVSLDRWRDCIPWGERLAASWQRRCQRWLSNPRIELETLYLPLVLWAVQEWRQPGQRLHLALDTTMLWNRYCVVYLSVVCHGRAVPLMWTTLEHSSASVSAEVCIALLERADRFLAEFADLTLLADRAFPSVELLRWFETRPRWHYIMRLKADTLVYGAGCLGCEVRRLRLPKGVCQGFRNVQLWAEARYRSHLVLAHPRRVDIQEPWYLITNGPVTFDVVWSYAQRFWCEELFRDEKSGLFQLASSRLRQEGRIDRLLLVVAIAVLVSTLQGLAVSLEDLRRQVDPHWKRGMSYVHIGLKWLCQTVTDTTRVLRTWRPIPLDSPEPCHPSRGVRKRKKDPWFDRVHLPENPGAARVLSPT